MLVHFSFFTMRNTWKPLSRTCVLISISVGFNSIIQTFAFVQKCWTNVVFSFWSCPLFNNYLSQMYNFKQVRWAARLVNRATRLGRQSTSPVKQGRQVKAVKRSTVSLQDACLLCTAVWILYIILNSLPCNINFVYDYCTFLHLNSLYTTILDFMMPYSC